MEEPIYFPDWQWPVRDKALDEETMSFARWIEFGNYYNEEGHVIAVDIHWSSGGMDIMNRVPIDKAKKIVAARNEFCSKIVSILND